MKEDGTTIDFDGTCGNRWLPGTTSSKCNDSHTCPYGWSEQCPICDCNHFTYNPDWAGNVDITDKYSARTSTRCKALCDTQPCNCEYWVDERHRSAGNRCYDCCKAGTCNSYTKFKGSLWRIVPST